MVGTAVSQVNLSHLSLLLDTQLEHISSILIGTLCKLAITAILLSWRRGDARLLLRDSASRVPSGENPHLEVNAMLKGSETRRKAEEILQSTRSEGTRY